MPAAEASSGTRQNGDHRVVAVAYDGIQGLDLMGPIEVFHGANQLLDREGRPGSRYRITVASVTGSTIETESGVRLESTPFDEVDGPVDTLVLPGGFGALSADRNTELIERVRSMGLRAERVVSVCTGAFIAAAAGLLDGKRVTTHWARAAALGRRHPNLEIDTDPIYVRDGDVWTSAGVTAGIDLTLAVVEHDHGSDVAQVVARWLVMFLRRPGGQTQFATPVWSERAATEPIRVAQELVEADPSDDHRVGRLAERVGLSERHFARLFADEVGVSPAQYVISVRLEAARAALESTNDTVEAIANSTGFNTAETMRRTFAKRLGVSPDHYRRRFGRQPATVPDVRPAHTPNQMPNRSTS